MIYNINSRIFRKNQVFPSLSWFSARKNVQKKACKCTYVIVLKRLICLQMTTTHPHAPIMSATPHEVPIQPHYHQPSPATHHTPAGRGYHQSANRDYGYYSATR